MSFIAKRVSSESTKPSGTLLAQERSILFWEDQLPVSTTLSGNTELGVNNKKGRWEWHNCFLAKVNSPSLQSPACIYWKDKTVWTMGLTLVIASAMSWLQWPRFGEPQFKSLLSHELLWWLWVCVSLSPSSQDCCEDETEEQRPFDITPRWDNICVCKRFIDSGQKGCFSQHQLGTSFTSLLMKGWSYL